MVSPDCGNSPKTKFLQDFTIASAKGVVEFSKAKAAHFKKITAYRLEINAERME